MFNKLLFSLTMSVVFSLNLMATHSASHKNSSKFCTQSKQYKHVHNKNCKIKDHSSKKRKHYKDKDKNCNPPVGTCGVCDGKITSLTLQYNGLSPVFIEAYSKKGNKFFNQIVSSGESFTLVGFDKKHTLGTRIKLYINGEEDVSIHTSCSEPVEIGMTFGSFTVRNGYSRNGGLLCGVFEDTNNIPIAQDQSITLSEEALKLIVLTATDSDDDNLTYNLVTQPTHGVLSGDAPNLTYTPNTNFYGSDSFTFKVNDSKVDSAVATVSINVLSINDAPVVEDQYFIIHEDTNVSMILKATDSDGDPLSYQLTTQPTHGILSGNAPNFTYTPILGYYGVDSFTYLVNDGTVDSQKATVTIEVTRSNVAPLAINQEVTTDEDTPSTLILKGIDSDNDTLEYIIITQPIHGTVSGIGEDITYTPDGNYSGNDTFTYKVNDGLLDSNEATVNVTVNPKAEETCVDTPTNVGEFNPVVKWGWKGSERVISAPIVVPLLDTNHDNLLNQLDVPVIIFISGSYSGTLHAVRGDTGEEIWSVKDYSASVFSNLAAGDIDGDGNVEIIALGQNSGIAVFEHTGELKWVNNDVIHRGGWHGTWGAISIADLDGDGLSEIIFESTVLNSDGSLRWSDQTESSSSGNGSISIVADIDLDGKQEVITGRKVYNYDGTIKWSNNNVPSGYVAIANLNNDKYPELVSVGLNNVYVINYKGEILMNAAIPTGGGGTPTIGDFDNDGIQEIGVAGSNAYTAFESDGTIIWSKRTEDTSSRVTGSSIFDFDNDKKAEIVYADEKYLRIYNGNDGQVLYQISNNSGTAHELPVIADVDGDGHAEIVFCGSSQDGSRIRVLEDANNTWMPTRSIWNQHSYHINNINDDGTIPRVEEPSWLTHNTYRLNTFAVDTRCQAAPVAYSGDYKTLENTTVSIKAVAVDINKDTLTYSIVKQPEHGTLSGEAPYYIYTPNSDYVGSDSFSYKVNDSYVDSNEANISIKILSSDNAPLAVDDSIILEEDSNVTANVLENDSNTTGTENIAIIIKPLHGTAVINNSKIVYTPNENYNGADELYYTYKDANNFVSNSAKVTFNIGESNDAPVADGQNLTVNEDSLTVITLQATDTDNDTLSYSIVSQPQHGTLNGLAPYISYTPDKDYVGSDSFSFKAFDGNLESNTATITLTIKAENDAPVSVAGNSQNKILGDDVTLNGLGSYDVDGNITNYEWREGNTTLSTQASFIISGLTLGTHTLTLDVTDNDGESASSTTIVEILPANTPDTEAPVISVLGDTPHVIQIGDAYSDSGAIAWDERDGNISVGVSYNFDSSVEGTHQVTYTAQDSAGNQAQAIRQVMVVDNSTADTTAPVITLLGNNPLTVYLDTMFKDPGVRVVDDHDGNIGYSYIHHVNTTQIGTYEVNYSAVDQAGNSSQATRTVLVRDPNGNQAPTANAGVDVYIALGETLTLDALQSKDLDGEIVAYEWKEESVILSTEPTFSKSDFDFGSHILTLTVTDNEGLSSSDTIVVYVTDPSDVTPPEAQITTPLDNTKVTLKTDIIGTAYDENLDSYEVLISPVNQNQYATIAQGSTSVVDSALATIDGSVLQNGIYDVMLKVTDKNGQTSTDSTIIIVEGKAKIGNFSFTITDFDISVGGLPLQVNRTYSTLQRTNQLAFGYGWSIDYQNVKVEENIIPGEDWKLTSDTLGIGYCFKFDRQHIVNISLTDGTTESFEFRFANECANYAIGSFYDAPKLYALNGSTAKLETIDASDSVSMSNGGEIIDSQTLTTYNPSKYRLTLSNGMVYEITEGVGLKLVKDIREDTLTYNTDGIISSRGESLTFERDSKNRITSITDLAGKSMSYHYDENDNLDYVIDQLGQTTNYTYQDGHLLEEYIDPSGTRVTKNYYDEAGRLIRTVDADGNEVNFTHNIDGREELVHDKLGRISLYVYDDEGNVLSYINPEGEEITYTYDEKGNTLTTTDSLGNLTTNTYDANGNLLSTTDAKGNTETTIYNSHNSPTNISDKNGNSMSITYDAYNAPTTLTTALGATRSFEYDNFGNKVKEIDENNNTTTYVYDSKYIPFLGHVSSKGNLLEKHEPNGVVTKNTYDESSNLLSTTITFTKADGEVVTNVTTNTYDSYNRLISTTDENSNTTTYVYDARGNKVSETDSQNRTTTYEYTPQNLLINTTYPDYTTESKTYDAMGNILSETNQESETTSYEYDGADRLIKTTYPDGTTTFTEYDEAGRVLSTTDANANVTNYTYDEVGNKTSTTDPLGNTTSFSYDAQGNMLSVTDALGNTTSYEYNVLNQVVKTTYADGTSTQELKNISGLPSKKVDENGNETLYSYDTSNTMPLLTSVTLANGATTDYSYNTRGLKTAQIDALGHTTNYTYTDLGELKKETLPQGESKTYTYDTYGKQTQIDDYANKTTKFIYDSNDKLVRVEYTDGNTVTYEYTPSGQIKQVTDNSGTITYTYDNRGRVKSITNQDNESINYTYDNVGNITQIQTPTTTISKTYTKRNELQSVTDASGTINYTYDKLGRQTLISYTNGMQTSYEYDSKNQVTKIEHKNSNDVILQSYEYTYDNNGNRIKVVEANSKTINYTYDDTNKLLSESISNDPNGNNTTTTYNYDEVGNLLTKTVDSTTTEFTYNQNDQLIQKANETLTYDANGNLVQQGNNSYSYDAKNRLISVTTPTDTIEYTYDANNNRTVKVVNGETTTYLIDTNTQFAKVITESKSNGTTINYTYGNKLLNQTTQNETLYYLPDALGSVRELADTNENLSDHYIYSPYGELLEHEGDSENEFLYTGEQYDEVTELYYLRARYYSPSLERFITRDTYDGTQDDPISQNHYLYANANPTKYTDPSGHTPNMMTATFRIVTMGVIGGMKIAGSSKKVAQGFQSAYKTLCKLGENTLKQATHWHHAFPVFLGNSRKDGLTMAILENAHRQFHRLLHYALRMKGYPGGNKRTYQALTDAESYKEIFNILMDSAEYFDKVCEPKVSMRSQIWKDLYK